jgi:hypothetical protein
VPALGLERAGARQDLEGRLDPDPGHPFCEFHVA